MLKALTTAAFLTAALALPAFAMDEMMMKPGAMMMMGPDGKMMEMMPAGDAMKMMDEAMAKNGKPMMAPMIMMMKDGKMMMMEDMKMDDGKMMSEHMMMTK
jgi:hypothetical protein